MKRTPNFYLIVLFLVDFFSIFITADDTFANQLSTPRYQDEFPGDLIAEETVIYSADFIAANPNKVQIFKEYDLSGPGVVYTDWSANRLEGGEKLDPSEYWCGYGGNVSFLVGNRDTEDFQEPYQGMWVDYDSLHVYINACRSSSLDIYEWMASYKVFFDPDPDMDKVPDSRDLCPGTPGGAEVDEQGCSDSPPVQESSPEQTCDLQISASPEMIKAGESASILLDAWLDGFPVASANVAASITSGPGWLEANSTQTDADGYTFLTYIAPSDISDFGTATIQASVEGCVNPVSATVFLGELLEPPPAQETALLGVSTTPIFFQELNDQIELTVTVTDSQGLPIIGESVLLIPFEPAGGEVNAATDGNGKARFTLTHGSEQILNYIYHIQAAGLERRINLPVVTGKILIETNLDTGEPYQGVAADGVSTLLISLYFPSLASSTLKFSQPPLGTLEGEAVIEMYDEIQLDGVGRAEITYRPPAYITDKNILTEFIEIYHSVSNISSTWSVKDEITFTYMDPNGTQRIVPLQIQIVRPPVMLVHGFLGSTKTWANFSNNLIGEKFDTMIDDYAYNTIESNSFSLKTNIEAQLLHYGWSKIKLSKVDVVAHSMGGLITRYYIEEMSDYGNNVRKLIMAGTPNHGVCYWKKITGGLASWNDMSKHAIAGDELYSGSKFTQVLNEGESVGQHLNMDVEYTNLIGTLYLYPASDGVVTTTSARLNGVSFEIYDNTSHSTAVPFPGNTAITEHKGVWGKIQSLLLKEIFRPPLENSRMEITRIEGEASKSAPGGGDWKSISTSPSELIPWEYVKTGEGKIIISLYLNNNLWGLVSMHPNSELVFDYSSPELVRILLKKGMARFKSPLTLIQPMHYEVISGESGDTWHEFNPRAEFISIGTDFIVQVDPIIQSYVLEGQINAIGYTHNDEIVTQILSAQQGTTISENGVLADLEYTPDPWWEDEFYDTASIERGGSSGIGSMLSASLCSWVVTVLLLIITLVINRKKKTPKWLRVVLIILSVLSTLAVIFSAFFSSSATSDLPEKNTIIPTVSEESSQESTREAGDELTIVNNLGDDICFLFIILSDSNDWGDDWLGESILGSGMQLTIDIPPGIYDILALDCDNNPIAEFSAQEISPSSTLEISP